MTKSLHARLVAVLLGLLLAGLAAFLFVGPSGIGGFRSVAILTVIAAAPVRTFARSR